MKSIVHVEIIEKKILFIRGKKVIIDRDLANLYGITTKVLNQAVKRNKIRFPEDFMFQLTKTEKEEVVTNCDHLISIKYSTQLPYVFTEHGALMLANVIKSKTAIEVSIAIIRTFVKLREIFSTNKNLINRLNQLENKFEKHDKEIKIIFDAIRQLMIQPEKPKRKIGF